MQKTGFFTKILFFKVSAWLSNHAVCKIGLKKTIFVYVNRKWLIFFNLELERIRRGKQIVRNFGLFLALSEQNQQKFGCIFFWLLPLIIVSKWEVNRICGQTHTLIVKNSADSNMHKHIAISPRTENYKIWHKGKFKQIPKIVFLSKFEKNFMKIWAFYPWKLLRNMRFSQHRRSNIFAPR